MEFKTEPNRTITFETKPNCFIYLQTNKLLIPRFNCWVWAESGPIASRATAGHQKSDLWIVSDNGSQISCTLWVRKSDWSELAFIFWFILIGEGSILLPIHKPLKVSSELIGSVNCVDDGSQISCTLWVRWSDWSESFHLIDKSSILLLPHLAYEREDGVFFSFFDPP